MLPFESLFDDFQGSLIVPQAVLAVVAATVVLGVMYVTNRPTLVFAYNCFVKPFLKRRKESVKTTETNAHQSRLEDFYEGQVEVYDTTRVRLLRGRNTMLRLCAGQLMHFYPYLIYAGTERQSSQMKAKTDSGTASRHRQRPSSHQSTAGSPRNRKRLAWIDIGGGTGSNIEKMNEYLPISSFDKVYCVDITPSMCEVARRRFEKLGWDNVVVVCSDATTFKIPEEDLKGNGDEELDVSLITFSYSLSMMETIYPVIDRIVELLSPHGIVGVADFYVSSKRSSSDPTRQLGWFMRWFWAMWFDLDGIYLHPSRRDYLEHKFTTVKMSSHLNPFLWPFIYIPYYVWVGGQKSFMAKTEPQKALGSPLPQMSAGDATAVAHEVVTSSPTEFIVHRDHVHGHGVQWREPFDTKLNNLFNTYIYAFAWEDPREDLKVLDLQPDDRMMVMTSGGCNVLEYALHGPARIHAVDMNPAQGHMLELKLASLSTFSYEDLWKLFGEGSLPAFDKVLETQLATKMSPYAYQFWHRNNNFTNLYLTGCSGLAIRIFQAVIKLFGLRDAVYQMCHADSLEEQWQIWETKLRPKILSPMLVKLLNNDKFLWGALGVPPNQMQMVLEDGTAYDYVANTLDPIVRCTLFKDDSYFFYHCLMLRYSTESCPTYLTSGAFETFRERPELLKSIRIHTDKIINVLSEKIEDNELTKAIVMDHLDWFSEEDAREEISVLARKVRSGGLVLWRSAGKHPWYNKLFTENGFECKPVQIREKDQCIDRVNMYASFWVGRKL